MDQGISQALVHTINPSEQGKLSLFYSVILGWGTATHTSKPQKLTSSKLTTMYYRPNSFTNPAPI